MLVQNQLCFCSCKTSYGPNPPVFDSESEYFRFDQLPPGHSESDGSLLGPHPSPGDSGTVSTASVCRNAISRILKGSDWSNQNYI